MGALLLIIFVGIMVLAIIGLGLETFFFGIARGAQQVVDNPLVDEAKEYLGDLSGTKAKGTDH